ncbi:MAG: glycosyltransferase [Gemmatimonadota bacterium]
MRVFGPWDDLVFAILTLVGLVAVGSFALHWVRLPDWSTHSILIAAASLLLLQRLGVYALRWGLLPFMRRPEPLRAPDGLRVGVATTFVPAYETIAMLEATLERLVALSYPHDTWVLDEGDDPRVRALCERLGAHHFSRAGITRYNRSEGTYAARTKHGNYNAWLAEIGYERYDAIAAFDPDHVPRPSFLERTLGYLRDPRIGYVQAAQAYYNQSASFIARGAAEETYAYYSSSQMASFTMGYPIITGCHNVHRTQALREIGGFAAHDADDLLMTLHYRAAGWRGAYVPEIFARGLTPVDWRGYLKQQRRWARSVLDVKFRRYPRLVGRLGWRERIMGGLHGLYYLQGVTTLGMLAVLAYLLATGTAPRFVSLLTGLNLAALFVVLAALDLYRQRFFLDRRSEWGLHLRAAVLRVAKWPQLTLAVWDVIRDRRPSYDVTEKRSGAPATTALVVPQAVALGGLLGAFGLHLAIGSRPPALVWIGWGACVAWVLGLLWTATWRFPAPFDRELLEHGWGRSVDVESERARGWTRVDAETERRAVG